MSSSNKRMNSSSRNSFNLTSFKNKARRESRKHQLWNPFGSHGQKRSNTMGDLENGGGVRDMTPARQVNSEPHHSNRGYDDNGISQDTSAGSPTLNGSDDSTLKRRKPTNEKDAVPATNGDTKRNSKEGKPEAKVKFGFIRHVEPKEPYTVANQLRATLLNSWINILLLAVPAGFAVNYAGVDGKIVFVVNFLAIIPLAALLSYGTEEVALRTGETIGGLINATFGNAVELIVGIEALIGNQVTVVKTSLIGSILSNLLLVLGMCFFFGGFGRQVQYFNKTVAQTAASLLALAVASNIIPTVFADHVATDGTTTVETSHIASLSRGTSVILLVVYGAYLLFQLKTHIDVFNEKSQKVERTPFRKRPSHEGINAAIQASTAIGAAGGASSFKDEHDNSPLADMHRHEDTEGDDEEEEEELATLSGWVALGLLLISTILVAFCAEFMVDAIDSLTDTGAISVEFVGLILLPIVGNAAEHVTAVTVAIKDKMDLAIGVAVGSSMQVSLFLIPFLVIVGWGMGNDDMNLAFDTFQVAVVFVTVLLVNYLIADGESHWLEGFLLMSLYLIIAVCTWWYPTS